VAPDKPSGLERRNTEGEVFACGETTYRETMIPQWNDITEDTSFSHFEYSSFHPNGTQGLNEKVLYTNELMNSWTAPEDGTYGFAVRSVDKAGNKSEWSLTGESLEGSCQITYDSTSPEILLELPTDGETYAGEINLRATCDEECDYINFWWRAEEQEYSNQSPDRRYHYLYDNGTTFEWTIDSLDAQRWGDDDSYVMEDGVYYFYAAGKDVVGNWAKSNEVKITIDNTPPVTTLNEEIEGIFTNDPILIEGQTTDALSGVDYVNLYYKLSSETEDVWTLIDTLPTVENSDDDSPFDWGYLWTPEDDGTYDIKASGTDTLGNEEQSAYIENLTYDTTPPSITILQILEDILDVTAEDLLSGTEKIEIKIDEGEWETYTPDTNLNTLLNNEPGTYTIYIKVTDKAGNITEDSTTYTIPQPPVEETTGDVEGTADRRVVYASNLGTGAGNEIEEDLEITTEDETNEEEVLGEERSCENPVKVFGYIYHDKNSDGEVDDNEDKLEDISVRIYYMDNGNEVTVADIQTDENGYWETNLCQGEYTLEIDTEDLPENLVLAQTHEIVIDEDTQEYQLNLGASDSRSFLQKYWYIVLIGAGILLTVIYLILSKGKKQQTYQ
jgi:hypothetical protein